MKQKKVLFLFLLFFTFEIGFAETSKIIYDPQISKEIQRSFAILTGTENLVIGGHCGYAGQKTPGLTAIQILAHYKRFDLIHKVLNGTNLCGQVYAARALLEFHKKSSKMNVADRMFIDDLQKSKKTVPACYGCIYQSISVREALEFSNKSPLAGISIFERSSVEQLKDIDK